MNVLLVEERQRLDDASAGSLVPIRSRDQQRQHDALHFRRAHVLKGRWYSMVEYVVGEGRLAREQKEENSASRCNEERLEEQK
jgi:hypothetical protein